MFLVLRCPCKQWTSFLQRQEQQVFAVGLTFPLALEGLIHTENTSWLNDLCPMLLFYEALC